MTLAFINLGTPEILLILSLACISLIAVAAYGKNTILGFFGSLLLAIIITPIPAFVIIWLFFKKTATS
ncbi:hypothetical protein [Pedobacter rhizosphaerae]|uniref:Uncharacterized protein n=1 Tax=Pedobacter rhizosphaerae TaxID=390241 RepID=A0A1H9QSF6_9SPHI|nr:hypothetical protein [Pedobacter rhizosphaerae]SER62769.1 hypothetical protein SAMN04488023_112104 [Pedobacter rhizosphaerae]